MLIEVRRTGATATWAQSPREPRRIRGLAQIGWSACRDLHWCAHSLGSHRCSGFECLTRDSWSRLLEQSATGGVEHRGSEARLHCSTKQRLAQSGDSADRPPNCGAALAAAFRIAAAVLVGPVSAEARTVQRRAEQSRGCVISGFDLASHCSSHAMSVRLLTHFSRLRIL